MSNLSLLMLRMRTLILVLDSLGVGAPLPEKAADGSWNRTELSSNDQLRKQLLGKNYERVMKASQKQAAPVKGAATGAATGQSGTAAPAGSGADVGDDEDDDEEGRAALVGKKKRKVEPARGTKKKNATVDSSQHQNAGEDGEESSATKEEPKQQAPSKGRKKATSYLDEILAGRSKKRKNR